PFRLDLEPLFLQIPCDLIRNNDVVFDQQNLHGRCAKSTTGRRGSWMPIEVERLAGHLRPFRFLFRAEQRQHRGVHFLASCLHLFEHRLRVGPLAVRIRRSRPILLHKLADLLPLIFVDSEFLSNVGTHRRDRTLKLKVELLIPRELRFRQNLFQFCIQFALRVSSRGSLRVAAALGWRSARPAGPAWAAWAAWAAEPRPRHELTNLLLLLLGQVQLFLNFGHAKNHRSAAHHPHFAAWRALRRRTARPRPLRKRLGCQPQNCQRYQSFHLFLLARSRTCIKRLHLFESYLDLG